MSRHAAYLIWKAAVLDHADWKPPERADMGSLSLLDLNNRARGGGLKINGWGKFMLEGSPRNQPKCGSISEIKDGVGST